MQGEERVADGPFERELLRKAFTLCGGTCEDNERVRACVWRYWEHVPTGRRDTQQLSVYVCVCVCVCVWDRENW